MPVYNTVPNQRCINVKKSPANRTNLYTTNSLQALDKAAKELKSDGGFKLYMYFAKNQNNYNFALSSKDFCEWSSLGIKAYRTAFEELKEKGYLVLQQTNGTRDYYNFIELPEEKEQVKEKEFIF